MTDEGVPKGFQRKKAYSIVVHKFTYNQRLDNKFAKLKQFICVRGVDKQTVKRLGNFE